MLNNREYGILEYRSASRNWSVSWDLRRQRLDFSRGTSGSSKQHPIRLRLDTLEHYRKDVDALTPQASEEFNGIICDWPSISSEFDTSDRSDPFERLAFLQTLVTMAKGQEILPHLENLFVWLLKRGSKVLWLQRYDQNLFYIARFRLLEYGIRKMAASRKLEETRPSFTDTSDEEMRENYWFALRLQFDLAEEWYRVEGFTSIHAKKAHRQSFLAYLQMLKDEPYRRDLEKFLEQQGCGGHHRTGVEMEVARLLGLGWEKSQDDEEQYAEQYRAVRHNSDEAIDRIFLSWFLQRYDLRSARRIVWRNLPGHDKHAAYLSLSLVWAAVCLFILQAIHMDLTIPWYHHQQLHIPLLQLWEVQAAVQGAALFVAAWRAPAFFNLMMPRALFGSLLTWITLVFTSLPGLWAIEDKGHYSLRVSSHSYLHNHRFAPLWAIPFLLFVLIFIIREIGELTEKRGITLIRSLITTVGVYIGSLFWGLLFAIPIRQVLEFYPESASVDWRADCLIPITIIGSSLAALFGIIVELVWDDKSITEPLEEPL